MPRSNFYPKWTDSYNLPSPKTPRSPKQASPTSVDKSRFSDAACIHDEADIDFDSLNKMYKKMRRISSVGDTSGRSLESCWGEAGSWQVFPVMPKKTEEILKTRKFDMYPKNSTGGSANYLLQKWGVGLVNTKGCKGTNDRTVGQDSCSISRLWDGTEVFCVMDGHGPDGHWPAERAAKTMGFFLQGEQESAQRQEGASAEALTEVFAKVQKDLEHWAPREDIGLLTCGTTAVCAMHDKAKNALWIATVGDSRALLIVPGSGVVKHTKDHKPSDPVERDRLEEFGCDVEIQAYDDGWVEERVYVKGERYPGLSMSRSLGDVIVEDKGVISMPEVVNWSLEGYSLAYLLLASDGVWEFMSNEEVSEFVLDAIENKQLSCQQTVKELLILAKAKWDESDPEYMDDITILLVPLDGRKPPAVERLPSTTGCAAMLEKLKECFGMSSS